MAEVALAAEPRAELGSATSGRMRAAGRIPAIVYGKGTEPFAISVEGRAFRSALSGPAGLNALLDLHLGGDTHLALARDIQRHPVKGTVTHVDFLIVKRDQAIVVDVPLALVGEALGVTSMGGMIVQDHSVLTIIATPVTIPDVIEVDISALELGQTLRLADITLPDGVTTEVDPETVIVTGLEPRVMEVESEEDLEAAAAAAAAEGEAAGEAAPGGGDDAGSDDNAE